MTPEAERVKLARSACLPCRKSKRRCDKKTPICDLCSKKEIQCIYPARHGGNQTQLTAQGPVDWMSDFPSTSHHSPNDEGRNTSLSFSSFVESDASAIYFLAPSVFQQTRLELPRLHLPISFDLSSLIGNASSVRIIAIKYFLTIHRWLPIVFKRGFFSSLLNPVAQRQTELGLLILCMKLCCTGPSEDGQTDTELYRIAKKLHHAAESTGPLSIPVLQAGILIAVYELGHAVYPAAYLTVGACARYGLALRIDRLSLELEDEAGTPRLWNELEERRRIWWAVLMLDRFLSLSNPSRPLSTEHPTFDTYLPVDDSAWDDGTAKPADVVSISTGFTLKMGSFARLAQATYLVSQALRSLSPAPLECDLPQTDQTAQLRRTLLSLVHAADRESAVRRLEFCAQSEFSLRLCKNATHFSKAPS
ncbi:putative fungal-specific transcription factor [Thelonectria olida]|uniref:Fungal-specific transcription factor n=1 Tax=Thelonectria olida TaxID=1576542 RepID=A0A9P8W3S5_9HYPO|nr:putative fungal-specific transcription factor [Thelonectria olida]